MPPQSSLTAEVSSLNSCSPLTKHTAIAGILNQVILWPFIIFNFYSPATSTKSHSMYFRKESKNTSHFFPCKPDSISESKVQIDYYYYRFLDTQHDKVQNLGYFFSSKIMPQVDANKTNIVHSILVPVLCVLQSSKPTITMRKVQLEVSRTSCITSSLYIFYQSICSA